MGKASREKGKRGERELANLLKSYGFMESRRNQQYNGSAGDADVVGLPNVHIEVKRVEKLNIHTAIKQAKSDARVGEMPAVFSKRSRDGWLVTMPFESWIELYKQSGNRESPSAEAPACCQREEASQNGMP